MISKLESAAYIYWGEISDIDDVHLQDSTNPEKQLIFKEAMENLSVDAKLFTQIVMELPDEFISSLGKPFKHVVIDKLRKDYGWTILRATRVYSEIDNLLR